MSSRLNGPSPRLVSTPLRVEAFRLACDTLIADDDPAAALEALGRALQWMGQELHGKPPNEQRALIMVAQEARGDRYPPW